MMLLYFLIAHNDKLHPYPVIYSTKHTQFSDVFSDGNDVESVTNENRSGSNRFVPKKSDASVENSLFYDCTASNACGGAVYCSNNIQRIFIEKTSFIACKTAKDKGGGIFFQNMEKGECAIFRTCSFNCSSTSLRMSSGQYAFIYTMNDAQSKNEVNESTITGSKKESANSYSALDLYYSNIIFSSINITNNECNYYPALSSIPTEKESTCTGFIIYKLIYH